jgi:sugar/nucleoside kinase (ribokinase family)
VPGRRPRIGCVGELLVEFLCTGKNGHNRRADSYLGPFPSGAPGIFIDQAARVGGDCIFVGAVGDDAFGDVILDRLTADGVDTRLIGRIPGVPTGSAFVSYNDDGSRDFVFNITHSAAARWNAGEATLAALADFKLDVMHVSGSALGSSTAAADIVKICDALYARGVKISFDPNIRKELAGDPGYFGAINRLMAISSIFLPSDADANLLFPGEAVQAYAARLFRQRAEYVVLKRGEHGAEAIHESGEHIRLPAHKVQVVDPTGAGDCFCATFVTLMATGRFDLADALARANMAGALAVTKAGPMEGNASLAAIEAALAGRGC